jgi:hypothetical protein
MTVVTKTSFTISQLWDSALLKMVRSIGLFVTHGELTGVKVVSSEFAEVSTTLPSKVLAHGPLHLTPGLKVLNTSQLQMRRLIDLMIKLFIPSLNQYTHQQTSQRVSFPKKTMDAVLKKLLSQVVRRRMLLTLGI